MSSFPLLLAALLLAASSSLLAQDRSGSRPSDSGDSPRIAVPRSGGGEPSPSRPSYSPPPPSRSEPPPSSTPSTREPGAPRTARPIEPGDVEPHRQRPRDRGHRGGSGWYDPYPHYYGRYYGPYWGGFWTDFMIGWWYDDYWWYHRSPYYYPYGPYRDRYISDRYNDRYGALDLDIHPGRTEVYIDGRYHGKVDAYDGFPQYLWLPRGTYDVVFYLDGYQTLARQISISPGMVIDVDDRMEPGESVRPEDLVSKSTERRDERLRYEEERRDRLELGERDERDERDDEDWRDRARRRRDSDRYDREEADREERSDSRGRLLLEVEPEDASVYLDGRFVGTGEELAGLRGGLSVDAGRHQLAVVRPGRQPVEKEIEVEEGEEIEVEIELEESPGR